MLFRSNLTRGHALWKIADHTLLAHHDRPATLVDVTDTDTRMRGNHPPRVTEHDDRRGG